MTHKKIVLKTFSILIFGIISISFSSTAAENENIIGTWLITNIEIEGTKYNVDENTNVTDVCNFIDTTLVIENDGTGRITYPVYNEKIDYTWEETGKNKYLLEDTAGYELHFSLKDNIIEMPYFDDPMTLYFQKTETEIMSEAENKSKIDPDVNPEIIEGTWEISTITANDSDFTFQELESIGEDTNLDNTMFVFKKGGAFIILDLDNKDSWMYKWQATTTDNEYVTLDNGEEMFSIILEDKLLKMQYKENIVLNFEKISENQTIPDIIK